MHGHFVAQNHASQGGALSMRGRNGVGAVWEDSVWASSVLTDCRFEKNEAHGPESGVYGAGAGLLPLSPRSHKACDGRSSSNRVPIEIDSRAEQSRIDGHLHACLRNHGGLSRWVTRVALDLRPTHLSVREPPR